MSRFASAIRASTLKIVLPAQRATGKLTLIERDIEFEGVLDEEQRSRLLAIANRCPVHLTLTTEMHIATKLA